MDPDLHSLYSCSPGDRGTNGLLPHLDTKLLDLHTYKGLCCGTSVITSQAVYSVP